MEIFLNIIPRFIRTENRRIIKHIQTIGAEHLQYQKLLL